jgi:hypothetical protein
MASDSERPAVSAAVAAALTELQGLTREREATGEMPDPRQAARPLEFDESGFPVAQPVTSFIQRVGRRLGNG